MLKLRIAVAQAAALALLTGLLPSPGAAADARTPDRTVWQWTTEDGVVSFTDDEKQIPARYRDEARSRVLGRLDDYERYTPAETPKVVPSSLPAVGAAPPGQGGQATAPPQGYRPRISVRSGGASSQVIDVQPGDEGPVIIEQRRARPDGGAVTRTNTIIRQGDRILTVIKPQTNVHDVTDFDDEEDFEDLD
jgi:hypothetical protein